MSETQDDAQGSDGWIKTRLGQCTASMLHAVMAKGKNGAPSSSRANYQAQLLIERLTGVRVEGFKSKAMEWGNEWEPRAADYYEFMTNVTVKTAKYCPHPTIPMTGATPDRYVGDVGLLEIKCPLPATHLETLLGAKIDRPYILQMGWQMACTGRQWVDFVSFCPHFPAHLQYHCRRVPRDSGLILEIQREVVLFNAELDDKIRELKAKFPFPDVAEAAE